MLRIVPHTVPRVGRSYEHFPDGFELHLVWSTSPRGVGAGDRGVSPDARHARGLKPSTFYIMQSWDTCERGDPVLECSSYERGTPVLGYGRARHARGLKPSTFNIMRGMLKSRRQIWR